ncbi:MAG: hypothetical protein ABIM74_03175 [candidate division WOR-3 bacterium]
MARVFRRGDSWCIDYTDALGIRRRKVASRTKAGAEKILRRVLDEVEGERAGEKPSVRAIPMANLIDPYLSHSRVTKKPSSYQRDITSSLHVGEQRASLYETHVSSGCGVESRPCQSSTGYQDGQGNPASPVSER